MCQYLSKIELDASFAQNSYEVHAALWSFFPGTPDAKRSFLYRVTWGRPGVPLEVLMQSKDEPQPSERADRRLVESPRRISIARLAIRSGQLLRFALCGNPTKRLSGERCRVPFIREEERLDWLRRKLDGAADVVEASVVASRDLHFRKKGVSGKIATVTFAGVLRVRDSEGLKALMVNGIGAAKSFGCGLLSLARA